jgi:lysophospholipase L1-like esterase
MSKTIRINIAIFLGLLLFIELSGQIISRWKNGNWLFANHDLKARHNLFSPHPYLSVTLNKNIHQRFDHDKEYHIINTTSLGTRETGADLGDTSKTRIVCIGGSTTFCTGVDDEASWPWLLQQKLGKDFSVINYGVPAYKSQEAVLQLALYVADLNPDIIVFYMGYNDFYNYYIENNYPDYFYHGEYLMPMALMGSLKYESSFDKFRHQSGFFYLIGNLAEKIYTPPLPIRHTEPDSLIDRMYQRNIKSMLALTRSMNAKTYFIGQVLNPFERKPETSWSIRVQKDRILPLMSRLNNLAEKVCEIDSNCTYLDFEHSLNFGKQHFWDDMHFNKEGNELFAESVKQEILK